jgi:hypothetical protein
MRWRGSDLPRYRQRIGRGYLGLGDDELEAAVAANELTEVSHGDEDWGKGRTEG